MTTAQRTTASPWLYLATCNCLIIASNGCDSSESRSSGPSNAGRANVTAGVPSRGGSGGSSSQGVIAENGGVVDFDVAGRPNALGGAAAGGQAHPGGAGPMVGGAASSAGSSWIAPSACSMDTDCGGTVPRCHQAAARCVACLSGSDCSAGSRCFEQSCQPIVACNNSRDCKTDQVCGDTKTCAECSRDADCPSGAACVGGVCRGICVSDRDCTSAGLLCDFGLGRCVECLATKDCGNGAACQSGACIARSIGYGGAGGIGAGGASGSASSGAGGVGTGSSIANAGAPAMPIGGFSSITVGGGNAAAGANASFGGDTGGNGGSGTGGSLGTGGTTLVQAACGNGNVAPNETCDDGNVADGDGCSSTCQTEVGFVCAPGSDGATITLPVTYRDFSSARSADFEPGATGYTTATKGLLASTLDTEGKPSFIGKASAGFITSAASFAQWYRDVAGVNGTTLGWLNLFTDGAGGFVNRFGANGEQFTAWDKAEICGNKSCTEWCTATERSCVPCPLYPTTYVCYADEVRFDGTPYFFPIDNSPSNVTPKTELSAAALGAPYDTSGGWPAEPGGALHNFDFTSELRFWFHYSATTTYAIEFTGDDDAWVFVNGQLVIDLGGTHTPVAGSITIDVTKATQLGLVEGQAYEVAVFQAERQKTGSTYRLRLKGFQLTPSHCER